MDFFCFVLVLQQGQSELIRMIANVIKKSITSVTSLINDQYKLLIKQTKISVNNTMYRRQRVQTHTRPF